MKCSWQACPLWEAAGRHALLLLLLLLAACLT
jgi:hypothetical protein